MINHKKSKNLIISEISYRLRKIDWLKTINQRKYLCLYLYSNYLDFLYSTNFILYFLSYYFNDFFISHFTIDIFLYILDL